MYFEHFIFRLFLVSDAYEDPPGPNIGLIWAPRGTQKQPKSAAEIDARTPFLGFDVGKAWKSDFGLLRGLS